MNFPKATTVFFSFNSDMRIIDAVAADVDVNDDDGVVVGVVPHVVACETGVGAGCDCACGCCVGGGGVGGVANEHDVSVIGGASVRIEAIELDFDDEEALFGSAVDVEGDIHCIEGALGCGRIIVVVVVVVDDVCNSAGVHIDIRCDSIRTNADGVGVDDEVIFSDAAGINCDADAEGGCRPHNDVTNDGVTTVIAVVVNEDGGDDDDCDDEEFIANG